MVTASIKQLQHLGSMEKYSTSKTNLIVKYFEIDKKAKYYFENFRFDNGDELPFKKKEEYILNASVLNTIMLIQTNSVLKSRLLKNKSTGFWKKISFQVNLIKDDLKHNLPSSERNITRVYSNYIEKGYISLISKKFGSQNSRKVNNEVSKLIEDISKQFNSNNAVLIKEKLNLFLEGSIQIIKSDSSDFYTNNDFNGLIIGVAAIRNNRVIKSSDKKDTSHELLRKEIDLSNIFFDTFSKLDTEIKVKLLEQFLSIIDLVNKTK